MKISTPRLRVLDVAVDGATARLTKAASGVQSAGYLPSASAKTLVGLARSARMFAEARERAWVTQALDDIDELAGSAEHAELAAMLTRCTSAVRTALGS